MYEKLIFQLSQLFRNSGNTPEALYPILLQLLAWVRVSKLGHLKGELAFNPDQMPKDAKELATIFNRIVEERPLGDDSDGFAFVSRGFQLLERGSLFQALDLLGEANLNEPWPATDLTISIGSKMERFFGNLPTEVVQLMAALVCLEPKQKVYLPFEQTFQLSAAVEAVEASAYSETIMASPYPWLVNLIADTKISIYCGDGLKRPGFLDGGLLTNFDASICFPPMGMRVDSSITEGDLYDRFPEQTTSVSVLAIRHVLKRLNGRAVIAIPNGLLFSPGAERQLREDLVRQQLIEAVISLPSALLQSTSQSFSIFVLNSKKACQSIMFVDGTRDSLVVKDGRGRATLSGWQEIADACKNQTDGQFSTNVAANRVLENDSQLQVSRYCKSDETVAIESFLARYKTLRLKDLVEIVRPLPISPTEGLQTAKEFGPADFPEYGYARNPGREVFLTSQGMSRGRDPFVKALDIAITIKGSVGKVAIFPEELVGNDANNWVIGQSCLVLRVKDKAVIEPRVLFSFLKSEIGQALLKQIVSGAAVPLIQLRELELIRIPIPSQSEQSIIIDFFERIELIQREIQAKRLEQVSINNNIWHNK